MNRAAHAKRSACRRVALAAAALALLGGCNANVGLRVGHSSAPATQPSVGPGGSFTGSGVSVRIGDGPAGGSTVGAVVGAGVLGVVLGGAPAKPAPPDASRTIHEQDCTRPVEDPTANLRCK